MHKLICARCKKPMEFVVPGLLGNVWYVKCRECGVKNKLEIVEEANNDSPRFKVRGVMRRTQRA